MQPDVVLDILTFWEYAINLQLLNFSIVGYFRFPSLLVYLFLYVHVYQFMDLGLNVIDVNKQKQTMVNWIDLVRSKPNNEHFYYYIASFMSITYRIINNYDPPKTLPKAQYLLQMSKDLKLETSFYLKIRWKLAFME